MQWPLNGKWNFINIGDTVFFQPIDKVWTVTAAGGKRIHGSYPQTVTITTDHMSPGEWFSIEEENSGLRSTYVIKHLNVETEELATKMEIFG